MKILNNRAAAIAFVISMLASSYSIADLVAGPGGDGSEQEADNVSDSVMSRPNPMETTVNKNASQPLAKPVSTSEAGRQVQRHNKSSVKTISPKQQMNH